MENLLAHVRAAYTDDEVVALTLAADVQWGRALMTVDLMDPRDIARAEFRGVRSLALRDLQPELVDGELMPVLVAEREPLVVVALVDRDLSVEPGAMRVELYPHGSGLIECGVLPNGTHLFLSRPDGNLAERTAELLIGHHGDDDLGTFALFRPAGAAPPQGLLAGTTCQLISCTAIGPERQDLGVGLSQDQWREHARLLS